MAAIHDLLAQIQDEALRDRIEQEVNKLAKTKKFGLVFEQHLPECTPLYDMPIKVGVNVMRRNTDEDKAFYVVLKVNGEKAICARKDNQKEHVTFDIKDIVRVAEFGEPIYPYLQKLDAVRNAPDSNLWHTLIEADNYHALQLLDYLYHGKVDCIYIDPPYNTGAKDWKYNNDYVDGNDQYRHSKWLSMMQRRLRLAKRLLNPKDSVLIVTIDEKEYLHLGCLLEEMFPEATITMATDIINPRAGVARQGSFRRSQEYIFFLQHGNAIVSSEILDSTETKRNPIWFSLMRTGSNSARSERPNLFYPVWIYPDGKLHSVGDNIAINTQREEVHMPEDNLIALWPLRPDGRENCWQLGRETLIKAFAEGSAKINVHNNRVTISYLRNAEKKRIASNEIVVSGKDENGALILKYNDALLKTKAPDSVWNKPSHDAGIYGSTLVGNVFQERRFSFPKSLYAVHDAIHFFVANKPNALILDFFAGSGTTLHAVNLLNAEDGGNRRCILVTNNEVSVDEAKKLALEGYRPGDDEWEKLGIARYVTWPRTVCSIEGHDVNGASLKGTYLGSDRPMVDGFEANAIFFKLGFLNKTEVALGLQFQEMLPTLWMKSGAIGECPELKNEKLPEMLILPKNEFAVLIDENAFAKFAKALVAQPEIQTVFLITDYEVNYRSMAKSLAVKTTYQLYRDYLDNFRINQGRN